MTLVRHKLTTIVASLVAGSAFLAASAAGAVTITSSSTTFANSAAEDRMSLIAQTTLGTLPTSAPEFVSTDGVVFENVGFVRDTFSEVYSLADLDAGFYELTLTDFDFPDVLSTLGATITTATDTVGSLFLMDDLQESLTVELAAAETYYLSIFAESSASLGLYGIELKDMGSAAVPIPAPAALFLSGLALVALGKRKRASK